MGTRKKKDIDQMGERLKKVFEAEANPNLGVLIILDDGTSVLTKSAKGNFRRFMEMLAYATHGVVECRPKK